MLFDDRQRSSPPSPAKEHHVRTASACLLLFLLPGSIATALDDDGQRANTLPAARLALDLKRGISIDRQFRRIPPESIMRFTQQDVQLIKSMGFDSIKVLVNPEPLMEGGHLDPARQWYLQEMVELVVKEGLPVVVCIHPEWEFKTKILSDEGEFARFLGFLEETARFLAAGWGPDQLVLQLMTEPGGNTLDWNRLQPRMWEAARRAMPKHTLILAGDQVGRIEGLLTTQPVDDPNVAYSFTFYDPFVLTLQGGEWLTPPLWSHLGSIPYPCSAELMNDRLPTILQRIPHTPADWRPAAEGLLREYGQAGWNREKILASIRRLADWRARHGGGLKIWCAEFGCYQRTIEPVDRYRYLQDVRDAFEECDIGWAYWSYNETLTVLNADRQPFGEASPAEIDRELLEVLVPSAEKDKRLR